ncbi:MAG TPA: HAD-IIA family hydrolase [Bellilinea sp.]|nr:HAD-IIA family hydrolase [Bellilinea sp.]
MSQTSYLIDMDGVLVRGSSIIPGADDFIRRLKAKNIPYLILTNNPLHTPHDLAHRFQRIGLEIPAEAIFTSAMATARFLHGQHPNGKAFAIGESGLLVALHEVGYTLTEHEPDYVILGETNSYNYEQITKAIRLVMAGAHFIATNPDPIGPTDRGPVPACGAMAALIEKATGKPPFFIGKPNPYMMRSALNYLGVHSEDTTMIGDRMDTDIVAGIQAGMQTILVLTGVSTVESIKHYPFQPHQIIDSVAELEN